MKVAAFALAALGLAVAGAATAAERATDLDYMKASRCKGLAEAMGADTAGVDAYLKQEGRGRAPFVVERAGAEMSKAKREARSEDRRDRLSAELTGACTAYTGPDRAVAVR
jgi:hypothetical protein